MLETDAEQGPAQNADKRSSEKEDRRTASDRRQENLGWPSEERRSEEDRRAYVGRRQAAAWRRS